MKKTKWNVMLLLLLTLLTCSACNGNDRPAEKPTPTGKVTQAPAETMTPTTSPIYSAEFDSFTEQLFLNDIAANTINLHYTLAYPENYGITEYAISLGDGSYSSMLAGYSGMRELKNELLEFEYGELSAKQQFTYDIMMDYIETELLAEDLLLYSEVLGPVTGYQAQLPVLLAEYRFRTVQDIEDYLALVALVDDVFTEIVEFEKLKSEAGLFMPDYTADAVIDQCRQFIENPEENYMLDVFETEMQELSIDGLTEEKKQEYIQKNRELITTELVAAYQILVDGLESLKGTAKNDKGLCYFEDGVRYYEYLVRSVTGSSKSVEKLLADTQQFITMSLVEMGAILERNPAALNEFATYQFCETEPDKILEDLIVKIQEDFPELPDVKHVIKYVHPSMEEHMSPAFYLTPPVDDYMNNVIYINKAQINQNLYTTMAHEGYPGHLYQNVYTASKNLPLIRNMFSYQGYSEGWATYVEYYSYGLGELDEDLSACLVLNNAVIFALHAYADMGIHYLGWGLEEVDQFLTSYGLGGEVAQWMFETMVNEPANYLSYFVGYMEMLNLRDAAEKAWGEEFTLKKFHEAVLTLGPAPFDLLEKAIEVYE